MCKPATATPSPIAAPSPRPGAGARAIFSAGQFASITNTGTLLTTGGDAGGTANNTVFMQGNAGVLRNSGTIEARGVNADGVFSNTAGSSFTARIENLAGGKIISQAGPAIRTLNGTTTIVNAGLIAGNSGTALAGGGGAVTMILQTGSQIVGLADGGGGNNTIRCGCKAAARPTLRSRDSRR
ncbi:hypothetical protein [Bradyrhizobium sp. USDA 3256]